MDIMRLRGAQMRIQGAGKEMAELFPNTAGSSSVGGCKQLLGRFIEVGGYSLLSKAGLKLKMNSSKFSRCSGEIGRGEHSTSARLAAMALALK